ncbi:MAG: DUF5666 domain-containing protein [Patescibacteria group bacterium]
MKIKITFFLCLIALYAVNGRQVYAASSGRSNSSVQQKNQNQEGYHNTGETAAQVQNQNRVQEQVANEGLIEGLKNRIKNFFVRRIRATLGSVSGQTLYVTDTKGQNITVHVTEETVLKRKFGGNSSLDEFKTGDNLAIIGKQSEGDTESSDKNELAARYIRNLSIARRNTVFSGIVTSKTDTSLTIETAKRGKQTVYVTDSTVIKEKNKTIGYGDLIAGDRLLVKGVLWDREAASINADKIMKLPRVTAVNPTPSD